MEKDYETELKTLAATNARALELLIKYIITEKQCAKDLMAYVEYAQPDEIENEYYYKMPVLIKEDLDGITAPILVKERVESLIASTQRELTNQL